MRAITAWCLLLVCVIAPSTGAEVLFRAGYDADEAADFSVGPALPEAYVSAPIDINGNVAFVPGRFGSALQFTNKDIRQYPAVGNICTRAGTMAFWFRADEPWDVVFHYLAGVSTLEQNDWWFYLLFNVHNQRFQFRLTDRDYNTITITGPQIPAPGVWTHLAATWDATSGVRCDDLFAADLRPAAGESLANGPVSAYTCADGRVRLLCNSPKLYPGRIGRDPLLCIEVDPDEGFRHRACLTVMDTIEADLPLRPESAPIADMAKIMPHAGGSSQTILYRVRTGATYEGKTGVFVNDVEKAAHGIYSSKLHFGARQAPMWQFDQLSK